ncbi:DUF202 domain-containing protein [Kitasatospora gansuensis]
MNRDPGLQPERTLLAWGRTALVLTVNAALVLRTGLADRQPGLVTLGGLLALTACATYGYGLRRRRQLERPRARRGRSDPYRCGRWPGRSAWWPRRPGGAYCSVRRADKWSRPRPRKTACEHLVFDRCFTTDVYVRRIRQAYWPRPGSSRGP